MIEKHSEIRRGGKEAQRGQTLIDSVAGVSIFFIAIAAILGQLPSFVSSYQSDVAGQEINRAERIARKDP